MHNNRAIKCTTILAAFAPVLVGGCESFSSSGNQLPADCIPTRSIRDYELLDDQNLIIQGPGSRAYHVVMTTPSQNIENEFAIGVLDFDGRVCPYGRDAILIDGPIEERIPIRSIELIDQDDVHSLKVQFGLIDNADDLITGTVIE